jgi:hypothetical protein
MRLRFALVVLLVACGDDGNMLPIGGGGNDGGLKFPDSKLVDARVIDAATDATPAGIDAAMLAGRVCLTNDSRQLDACVTTGAGGLTVRLGTSSAVTGDDGRFMIAAATATVWTVTGSNIVTSVEKVGDYEIPAITRTQFDAMIAANVATMPPNAGEGHVIAQLIRNGAPVMGATATQPATATWAPFYDGADATTWKQPPTQAGTGALGAVWIPNIDVGAVNVTFTSGATNMQVTGLPILDGAITFTTVIFP